MEAKQVNRYGSLGIVACELVELLKNGKPGDVLPDSAIHDATGYETWPDGRNYPSMLTAIRYCIDHFGVTWQRISGEKSVKCLAADEAVALAKSSVRTISRKAKRTANSLGGIDYSALSDDEQKSARALAAQCGTLAAFSSSAARKRLEHKEAKSAPDLGRLMEVF